MTENISTLLEYLALHGGKIVSTASLTPEDINQARASGRMYVDEYSLGYVWKPEINLFPETPEEVEQFEKWYPLPVELPQHLKDPSFLLKKHNLPDESKEILVGILNKPYGIKGFIRAEVGHPVYETQDRYVIYLQHETLPAYRVPFYKTSFRYCINPEP